MDIQRSLIIAALILLSVLLLTEWVEFRAQHSPNSISVAAEQNTDPALTPDAEMTIPSVDIEAGPSQEPMPATAKSPSINVLTDTLNLRIALLGGDILGVTLPRHLATLGKTEQPFQ